MRIAALLVALFAAVVSALYSSKDDVVVLTDKDFDKTVIRGDGVYLVEFYAPWCGHCKSLAPEWKKAAKALKGIVTVAAVDASQYSSIGGRFNVQGFPTIKLFGADKNEPIDYSGARDAASITSWAMNQAQNVVKSRLGGKGSSSRSGRTKEKPKRDSEPGGGKHVVTLTPGNFDDMVFNSNTAWMIEFYAPWCGHCKNLAPEWAEAAANTDGEGVRFGAIDADAYPEIAQRFGIRGFPTIKMFLPGATSDADARDYTGGRTAADLTSAALVLAEQSGSGSGALVTQLTDAKVWNDMCTSGRTQRVCFLAILPHILDDQSAKRNARLDTFTEVAKNARGKPFRFLWAEVGSHPELENMLNVGLTPAVYAIAAEKNMYSIHKGAFETSSLNDFVASLLSGRASPAPFPRNFDLSKAFSTVDPWDGQDAEYPEDIEYDYEL